MFKVNNKDSRTTPKSNYFTGVGLENEGGLYGRK